MDELSQLVSPDTLYHVYPGEFSLESGGKLSEVRSAYRTWGTLNAHGDNAVVVCHALTGSADVDQWWPGMLGPDRALDPDRDFVICANILGSCYGTTGPRDIDPSTGSHWGPTFPVPTIRDMVKAQVALVRDLGVRRVRMVIGGSLGGMQALEWALMVSDLVQTTVPIAISGRHSAWCIGISEAQRQAIFADSAWNDGRYSADTPPTQGMAAARMMAMCSYRSWPGFESRFGRKLQAECQDDVFQVENYLRYQGTKLNRRFDANTYVTLTRAMDSHDVGRGRGDMETVLSSVRQPTLIVSIDSDGLYPPPEQQLLARHIPNGDFSVLHSPHGHDAFLIDVDELSELVLGFSRRNE